MYVCVLQFCRIIKKNLPELEKTCIGAVAVQFRDGLPELYLDF